MKGASFREEAPRHGLVGHEAQFRPGRFRSNLLPLGEQLPAQDLMSGPSHADKELVQSFDDPFGLSRILVWFL